MLKAGQITDRPAGEGREEGINLIYKDADKTKVDSIRAMLKPGRDWLLGIARRFFDLQQNMEAQRKRIQKEAAEQRRRARVLAIEEDRSARRLPSTIAEIIRGIQRGARAMLEFW